MKKSMLNCREAYSLRSVILVGLLTMLSGVNALAQLYTDASNNLPDNGAKGQSMDVRAIDIDLDNDLDLILANEFQPNTILVNNGQGIFTKASASQLPQENHDSEDIAIADFNGDGYLDLIFASEDDITLGWSDVHEFYLGDGEGNFTSSSYSFPDSEANAVLVIDMNNDARPDVIFGNNGFNRAYINQGDGTFLVANERLPEVNRTTQDLAAADIDGDGDLDLVEGNENGNLLLLNDGNGFFTDVTATHLPQGVNMETRKVTFGDVDHDNDQDMFLSNVRFINGKNPQNRLYINDGSGHFTDATSTQLPADADQTIDAIFEDVDLDGDPDLILANVFGSPIMVYKNNGNGRFEVATEEIFGENYIRDALGVIAADLNGDGLKDLYFADRFMAQSNRKDLLLIRNSVTGTESQQSGTIPMVVYPNPVRDEFYIQIEKAQVKKVRIENLQGQLIDTLHLDPHAAGIVRGSLGKLKLPAGMYILNAYETGKKAMIMVE